MPWRTQYWKSLLQNRIQKKEQKKNKNEDGLRDFWDNIKHTNIRIIGVLEGKGKKAMVPHSSTLAWKIPWTEEPGRLQSMGLRRVRHGWATSLSRIGEGNGNPLQCSCLENPRDRAACWAAVYGVAQRRTRLKRLSSSSSRREKGLKKISEEIIAGNFPNRGKESQPSPGSAESQTG